MFLTVVVDYMNTMRLKSKDTEMIWLVLHFWILSNTCIAGHLTPWLYFYWGPSPSRADIKMSATLISAVKATVDVEYHVLSEVPSLTVSVPLEESTVKGFVLPNNDIFEQTDYFTVCFKSDNVVDIFEQTDYFTVCFKSDTAFHMVLVLLTNDKIRDVVRPLFYTDWGHMYTVIALVGKPSVLVLTIKHLTLKIERHYANNDSIEYTKLTTEVILKTYNHLLIPLYGNYHATLPCQGAVLEAADKFGVMYLTRPPKQYSSEHAVPDKLSGKKYLTYRFGQNAGGGKYYIVSQELETKLDIVTKGKGEPVILHEIGNRHEVKIEKSALAIVSEKDVIVIFASQSDDQLSNMVPLERFKTSYILIVPFGLPNWAKNLITLIHKKVDSGKINLDGRALVTPVLFDYDGYTCEDMSETPVYLCFVTEFIVRSVRIIFDVPVDVIDEPAVIEILSSKHTEPYHVKYSPDYIDETTADLLFTEPIAVKIMKIRISIKDLSPVYTVGGNSERPHLSDLLHDRVKYQTCIMTRDFNELQIDIGQMVLIYLVIFYVPDITAPWTIQLELYDTNGSSVFETIFTHQGVYTYFAVINEHAERIILRFLDGIFGICEVETYAEISNSETFTETVDESMSTETTLNTYVEDEVEDSALLNYTLDFIKVLFWLSFILIVCFVVDANLRRRRKQKAERVVKE
ncbi:uncharacterized protein LOC131954540 [Physella acuta]|uniref:uncharacterized protein LOC131954540 n=1 Tax=Physella acuta TaxID=109671 RepID=UPI0027DCD56E|nr:uncharacterized protein LOC131954540 [Physella acuta]